MVTNIHKQFLLLSNIWQHIWVLILLFALAHSAELLAENNALANSQQQSKFNWKKTTQIPRLLASGKLKANQIPNPHWKKDACLACHSKDGKQASVKNLRLDKHETLCLNCHDALFDHSYIHPVDVKQTPSMKKSIKPEMKKILKKTNGKITCTTCHDLSLQCLSKNSNKKGMNPKFFRSAPFKTRTEQCYFCHDEKQYQRLNPHDQIDEQGNIKENTCRICHAGSIKELRQANSINEVKFNAKGNLNKMCWGCHRWVPHPGGKFLFFKSKDGPNHLVKPSEFVMKNMKKMTKKHNLVMPLEPETGKVFCGTCHNPHKKNVIPNKAAAKGATSDHFLRAEEICQYCHLK